MSFWWAFPTTNMNEVVAHLGLEDTHARAFADGMREVRATAEEETLFVVGPIDGWVLAFGSWPGDQLEAQLMLSLVNFPEVQAFASDDATGRRAWLRARGYALLRAMVFDGEGYPFTRGERTPGEPQFPQLLATPTDADVRAMARAWSVDPAGHKRGGIVGKRQTVATVPETPENEEDDDAFIARVGAHYRQNHRHWERGVLDGSVLFLNTGLFTMQWPEEWGMPDDGPEGSLMWSLSDAVVGFQTMGGLKSAPAHAEEWMNFRHGILSEIGWVVIGGQKPAHRAGRAMETGEASAKRPRIVRATRWLFKPPHLFALSMSSSDTIPYKRGQQLVQAFDSLRPVPQ